VLDTVEGIRRVPAEHPELAQLQSLLEGHAE
jgi:hypothetical protein